MLFRYFSVSFFQKIKNKLYQWLWCKRIYLLSLFLLPNINCLFVNSNFEYCTYISIFMCIMFLWIYQEVCVNVNIIDVKMKTLHTFVFCFSLFFALPNSKRNFRVYRWKFFNQLQLQRNKISRNSKWIHISQTQNKTSSCCIIIITVTHKKGNPSSSNDKKSNLFSLLNSLAIFRPPS